MDGIRIAAGGSSALHSSSGRVPALRATLALVLAAVWALMPSIAWGQQPAPTPAITQPPVTIESVEALRKAAADAPDLDAEVKQKIEAACVEAVEGLKRIPELAAQAEQFTNNTENIQKRADELRQRLAELQSTQPSVTDFIWTAIPELEQEVTKRDVALAQLKSTQTRLETAPSTRAARRREIRESLLSSDQRIAEIQRQLDAPPPADESPLLTQARRAALTVRRMLIEAARPALQNELAMYDAEDAVDFVRLERDVNARESALAAAELKQLQDLLSRRRAADSAKAVDRAMNEVAAAPAPLKPAAEENLDFANKAHELTEPIEEARQRLAAVTAQLENLRKQFQLTEQRVNEIGLTGSIGTLLRRQRVDLPKLRQLRLNVRKRKETIEETQSKLFDYDDQRSETVDVTVRRIYAELSVTRQAQRNSLKPATTALVERRREYLDAAIRNHNTYLDTLYDLDITEERFIREIEQYQNYIDERVLWISKQRAVIHSHPRRRHGHF